MLTRAEAAAEIHSFMCRDPRFGYDQVNRWGEDGQPITITLSDGEKVTISAGSYDCSSSIITAYKAAGVNCGDASYTGNMRSEMVGSGCFTWHPRGDGYCAKKGDIYLNESHHTAMCQTVDSSDPSQEDMLSQFSRNEKHGATGGDFGDNDGLESVIKPYYDFPWDGKLVCISGSAQSPAPTPAPTSNVSGITEDGLFGYASICLAQQEAGTPVDSVISGQPSWVMSQPGIVDTTGWRRGSSGSPLVKAIQRVLGVDQDGFFGICTWHALEARYGFAPDSRIDSPSETFRRFQHELNERTFF